MQIVKSGIRVQEMFGSIAARYDLTNSVLSFGIHHLWRRALAKEIKCLSYQRALDLCTGTGDLLPILAKRFEKVVGADFCAPMLEIAAQKTAQISKQIELVQADAMQLPFASASFDLISVAFGVRNFENLEQGLSEIARVLKPSGQLLILEFGQPQLPGWKQLYKFYSEKLLPGVGSLITGNRQAYDYLNRTAGEFPCAHDFCELLRKQGFRNVSYRSMSAGICYLYTANAS